MRHDRERTPGPWTVETSKDFGEVEVECIVGPEGYPIVKTDSGVYPPGLGDAYLIAAAPELLAELENAEWSSDGSTPLGACPRCTLYSNTGHAPDCSLAAALKKAKGL